MSHNGARDLLVDNFKRTRDTEGGVAATLKVNASTVRRLARQRRETDSVELRPALPPSDLGRLDAHIEARPGPPPLRRDGAPRRGPPGLGLQESPRASEWKRPRRHGSQSPLEGRGRKHREHRHGQGGDGLGHGLGLQGGWFKSCGYAQE